MKNLNDIIFKSKFDISRINKSQSSNECGKIILVRKTPTN